MGVRRPVKLEIQKIFANAIAQPARRLVNGRDVNARKEWRHDGFSTLVRMWILFDSLVSAYAWTHRYQNIW